ncbi:NAD-glutamate dehydrogenase, partial [Acidimicrobiaceae bacterium USS-CC1]|nr:NAD-glutamate dehydrogenase [Acidiferrimicrobium australe]
VELVEARFAVADDGREAELRARLAADLAAVEQLEQDQVLRGYLALVDATLRTSYPLRTPEGEPLPTVTLKLASRSVPDLPAPHPLVETWVHGPDVEGIHLRFGPVARGGIRWSDRPEDFRTEVLGLAAAQVKKNAVIVPTGAKGGFVCRGRTPASAAGVRQAYETFISSLLDITDNYVGGRVVSPPGVVTRDGEDPYLVVAADKGTATFSDAANALSEQRHFWLGDAFASGGSHGYDHKAMGITARGAWVAVRRHFHQLGIDVQTETVTVAGIGDMSGDVFGNGMLQSQAIALVAAFDHRHVFLDPDPDPKASFAERQRLAALGRSSWDDYDRTAISEGGGVWSREAKTVPLSPQARRALGVTAAELSPPELISAILRAPVDLLWFGGIGTYIKASDEADSEVGDHANDAVRVTADQVRARVLAEGGNLGVTQRGRIRYSRRGGRINADFIDNAAGVATSDREVNLKILVDLAIAEGRLDPAERDAELQAAEPFVAEEVLRQVDHSVAALNRAVPASARELDAYEALL